MNCKFLFLFCAFGASVLMAQPTPPLALIGQKGTLANIPATCTVGRLYFATDATAGQNIYDCTATNVWTKQGGAVPGTVTTVSVATANGFAGTVANQTTTPAISVSFNPALVTGLVKSTTATGVATIATSADIIADFSGTCNSTTVLAGDGTCATVSSAFSAITSGTNTAAAMLVGAGASLGTTSTGTIAATSVTGLSVATGKTLTVSNILTFTATDSSSVAFGAGGTVLYSIPNYWTSTTHTGIGPTSFTPVGTLEIKDATASTGETLVKITHGASTTSSHIFDVDGNFFLTGFGSIFAGQNMADSSQRRWQLGTSANTLLIANDGVIQASSAANVFTSADTGLSRGGAAATWAMGNGTAGNASGTLSLANLTLSSGAIVTGGKTCTINTTTGVWSCV